MENMEVLKQLFRDKVELAQRTIEHALDYMPDGEARQNLIKEENRAIENYTNSIAKIDQWVAEAGRNIHLS